METTSSKKDCGPQHVIVDNPVALLFKTRSDTYTVPANGVVVSLVINPLKVFSIEVKGTGAAATSWDIRLEVSLDGINFTQVLQHTHIIGDGITTGTVSILIPALYFRSRCVALVLNGASDVVTTILGTI